MKTIENNFMFPTRKEFVAFINAAGMKVSLNTANNWAQGHTAAATEHIAAIARILKLTDEELGHWVRSYDPGWGMKSMSSKNSRDTNCY